MTIGELRNCLDRFPDEEQVTIFSNELANPFNIIKIVYEIELGDEGRVVLYPG